MENIFDLIKAFFGQDGAKTIGLPESGGGYPVPIGTPGINPTAPPPSQPAYKPVSQELAPMKRTWQEKVGGLGALLAAAGGPLGQQVAGQLNHQNEWRGRKLQNEQQRQQLRSQSRQNAIMDRLFDLSMKENLTPEEQAQVEMLRGMTPGLTPAGKTAMIQNLDNLNKQYGRADSVFAEQVRTPDGQVIREWTPNSEKAWNRAVQTVTSPTTGNNVLDLLRGQVMAQDLAAAQRKEAAEVADQKAEVRRLTEGLMASGKGLANMNKLGVRTGGVVQNLLGDQYNNALNQAITWYTQGGGAAQDLAEAQSLLNKGNAIIAQSSGATTDLGRRMQGRASPGSEVTPMTNAGLLAQYADDAIFKADALQMGNDEFPREKLLAYRDYWSKLSTTDPSRWKDVPLPSHLSKQEKEETKRAVEAIVGNQAPPRLPEGVSKELVQDLNPGEELYQMRDKKLYLIKKLEDGTVVKELVK